ncbi:GntR family transcriptional regulator [Iodidimonas muriae]|uniref:GntR family transcriptional regulator n=1 Tax=Iodidimonas muriae TaxID=261467 RepID=A0ABQ2LI00_9PROT|nr:FadR/GntR family transcriptional regulator [Iodidimonas muriae]GER08457.1 GntR family transcriptional regulator [Kordiimonadales bacterium JCM 17843]GGO16858.1 GntR family transcriptional regulator [Iodidimonas muriae]
MAEKRLYHSVAKQIKTLVQEGAFPPGSRLPGERDLAEKLGVSRVTVREAQIALEAVGLLDIRVGSGVYVLRQANESMQEMPAVTAFELTEARSAIESEAAALAAVSISDDELDALDDIVATMAAETDANEPLEADADRQFHLSIARATKNNAIIETVERLWRIRTDKPDIKQAYDQICGINPDMRLTEHQDIAQALRAHDPEQARRAMRTHFKCIIEAMLSATEAQAIEEARRKTLESRERFLNKTTAVF